MESPNQKYVCTCCGKSWNGREKYFGKSKSPLFRGNDGFVPICKMCVDRYFITLVDFFSGNEEKAIDRFCQIFDWYYDEIAVEATKKTPLNRTRISAYPSKLNLAQSQTGVTYLDTIKDRNTETLNSLEELSEAKELKGVKVTQKTMKFWGAGFSESDYQYLNDKYDEWTTRHECNTKAQESLFQKIALLELKIMKATQTGEKLEGLISAYNTLLGSANVKPVQNNDGSLAEDNTFGTLIQRWENEQPIPEPDPEWKDVDGIRKYISVWFLGHLCKMMGVNNTYSKMYEEEIRRLSVEPPSYSEDEVASEYDSLFGDDNGKE